MRRALATWMLLLPATAHAGLGDKSSGVVVDVSGGLGAAYGMPVGVGAEVGVGGWFGKVDDAFAIGRTWSFGARVHSDFGFEPDLLNTRTAVTLEFHRTIYLLVVALRFGAQAGAVLRLPHSVCVLREPGVPCDAVRPALGGTVIGDAALVYRFHRNVGLQLKGELGLDLGATEAPVVPVGGFLVGLTFEAPVKRRTVAVAPTEDPVDQDWSETLAPAPSGEPAAPPTDGSEPIFPGEPP